MAENGSSYSKRPLWQWILIYVVVGGLIYAFVYFVFLKKGYSNNQYGSQSYQNTPVVQSQQSTPTSQPTDQSSQNVMVVYDSNGFTPKTLTIKAGQTVTWQNKDTDPLQIASNPHPTHTDYPPLNGVGLIQPGQSKSFTFPISGKFGYHNHLDPKNMGEIDVE